MKQLYSDFKKILFVGAMVLAALGWINAAYATRELDTIMVRESGIGMVTEAPRQDRIAELLAENPRQYHSTVRVLPHTVYGMTAAAAQAVHEAHRRARPCDWLELGCFIERETGL